jgi:hypothetical protein
MMIPLNRILNFLVERSVDTNGFLIIKDDVNVIYRTIFISTRFLLLNFQNNVLNDLRFDVAFTNVLPAA